MGKQGGLNKIVWLAIIAAIAYVVWFNFHKFVLTKNYDFYVEAPCNPAEEVCFVRDCEDYCPPNGMAVYKVWAISAADFKACADETCEEACEGGVIKCDPVVCNPEEDDCAEKEEGETGSADEEKVTESLTEGEGAE
jgi:hypothetical protein